MKKKNSLSVLLCRLVGCRKRTVDNSLVEDFDLNRYLGEWYEIARFDHKFERGMDHTKARYVLRDDGKVDVLNTGLKNGEYSEAKGIAKRTVTPSLLRVSFWGPFYSDYRVLMIDPDYQYVLVGSRSEKYLWIMSRTPQITEEVKSRLIAEARRRGYDTDKLIWVKQ